MQSILHKIKSSYIQTNEYKVDVLFSLYIIDVFDREWCYTKNTSEYKSKDILINIQKEELKNGYFNPSNYWVYNSEQLIGKVFDSKDEIEEIFSSEAFNYDDIELNSWCLYITTKGGLYYRHSHLFKDYNKLKVLVKKIKEEKIVNLNNWICEGSYEYDIDNPEFNEFKEANELYDEMSYNDYYENKSIEEINNMIENDRLEDSTVPGFRD